MITAYRDHGHMLVTGMDPRRVMAELTGRATGYSKGKGGSMHMFARDKRFFGGHGIVGACVPIGTGLAFAHKYREDGGVCLCFFGDGATNQGQVYRIVQHGGLVAPAGGLRDREQQIRHGHLDRARRGRRHRAVPARRAYGIPGAQVDGMDVLAVHEAGERGAPCRGDPFRSPGAMTYRYRGHSMSDPAKYRTRTRFSTCARRDPDRLRKLLLDEVHRRRRHLQADRQGDPGDGQRGGELRPGQSGAGSGLATDVYLEPGALDRLPERAMPTEVLMPALSPTMTEGNLARWLKEGDTVAAGDVIAEIETDKATMEVEAVDEEHAWQDPGRRGHRERAGEHADRVAARRRRGCLGPRPSGAGHAQGGSRRSF